MRSQKVIIVVHIEHPELLEQQETHDDGNAILEHVFGSKEVSSHTANRTAESTDLNDSLVKKMRSIVATMVMGSLSKKLLGGEHGINVSRSRSKGLLNSFLDSDNDGSMLDDVLGLAFKAIFR